MRVIVTTLLLVCLTGCSALVKKVYVEKPVPYTHPPLNITPPDDVQLLSVTVKAILSPDGDSQFILDKTGYKNIILNNKKVEAYIKESRSRIEACEVYYTKPIQK